MGWEDWLREIEKLDEIQQATSFSKYDDAMHLYAHNAVLYWFGKIRGDTVPIPENAEDILVEIIKRAQEQRLPGDRSYGEVILALLCGLLMTHPLDPMEAMIQAVHIGAALKGGQSV